MSSKDYSKSGGIFRIRSDGTAVGIFFSDSWLLTTTQESGHRSPKKTGPCHQDVWRSESDTQTVRPQKWRNKRKREHSKISKSTLAGQSAPVANWPYRQSTGETWPIGHTGKAQEKRKQRSCQCTPAITSRARLKHTQAQAPTITVALSYVMILKLHCRIVWNAQAPNNNVFCNTQMAVSES